MTEQASATIGDGGGVKADDGKLPLHLLPLLAIRGVSEVLGFGAKKYTAWNWIRGMAWSRLYAAALRHLFAWWYSEGADSETKLSHLKHAMCCIAFLIEYEERQIGTDDRPPKREST